MNNNPIEQSPFEAIFNFEAGSTPTIKDAIKNEIEPFIDDSGLSKQVEITEDEQRVEDRIDELKTDHQLETIHTSAMEAFYQQQNMAAQVDPKFSARNSEVAAQFLTIALNATASKAKIKLDRQKQRVMNRTEGGPKTVNNNLIVADRNSLLKELFAMPPVTNTENDK
jgi:hypothetical protein